MQNKAYVFNTMSHLDVTKTEAIEEPKKEVCKLNSKSWSISLQAEITHSLAGLVTWMVPFGEVQFNFYYFFFYIALSLMWPVRVKGHS